MSCFKWLVEEKPDCLRSLFGLVSANFVISTLTADQVNSHFTMFFTKITNCCCQTYIFCKILLNNKNALTGSESSVVLESTCVNKKKENITKKIEALKMLNLKDIWI